MGVKKFAKGKLPTRFDFGIATYPWRFCGFVGVNDTFINQLRDKNSWKPQYCTNTEACDSTYYTCCNILQKHYILLIIIISSSINKPPIIHIGFQISHLVFSRCFVYCYFRFVFRLFHLNVSLRLWKDALQLRELLELALQLDIHRHICTDSIFF